MKVGFLDIDGVLNSHFWADTHQLEISNGEFWSREEREQVSEYYRKQQILYEWHYTDISKDEWYKNINSRNEAVLAGVTADYFADEGLLEKLNALFETPNKEEVDVWYVNQRK